MEGRELQALGRAMADALRWGQARRGQGQKAGAAVERMRLGGGRRSFISVEAAAWFKQGREMDSPAGLAGPTPGMSERERQVMKKLKEVVDKQRDEIRAKDRELGLKNEDVEAVSDVHPPGHRYQQGPGSIREGIHFCPFKPTHLQSFVLADPGN